LSEAYVEIKASLTLAKTAKTSAEFHGKNSRFSGFLYIKKTQESAESVGFPHFPGFAVSFESMELTNPNSLEKHGKPGINIPRFHGF